MISACLVIHNEEKLIRRCLESINDAVDEIIVVHDGPCSDDSLKICREYTKKIFVRDFVGEAEPHRPFSFSKAKGDWILWIDADEYLSEELKSNLRRLAEDPSVNAYRFIWEVPYKDRILKKIGLGKSYRLCFFRKDSYEMKGIPHESPKIKGTVIDTNLILRHRPLYNPYCWETFKKKELRWARIQAEIAVKQDKSGLPSFLYILKGIGLFCFVFLRHLICGSYLNGIPGLKISFFESLYNYYVNWHIFKIKSGKKSG